MTEQQLSALKLALEALRCTDRFITNGIALGFIRMPDADTPDPAHETPGMVRSAITTLRTAIEQAETAQGQEPVKLRRGDVLRCIETDELCTVWATSSTHKTLVKWGGNDFSDYTAEQIGELFWLEPESSEVEIAAEQSDNYAAFHAGVRFARAHTLDAQPAPVQEPVKRWPFVETPEQFSNRLFEAIREFGQILPAVRNVLIENPPAAAPVKVWDAEGHDSLMQQMEMVKAENQRLLAANRDCIDHFDQIKADYDALKAQEQKPTPTEFYHHVVENEGDWSEWVNPNNDSYMMKCCDCGLVHEMQFKVAKYSKGDECEFVNDPDLQPVFRARRADVARQENAS